MKLQKKIRSAVYRTFVREKINKVPEKEKEKKFKEYLNSRYDSGFLHIDVTYLPKTNSNLMKLNNKQSILGISCFI